MSSSLSVDERYELITRTLEPENISNTNAIRAALEKTDRKPRCLWVTSPTGKPHIGYYIPLLKFADLLKAGVEIVIVLLDVYSFLDNVKYPWEQVRQRMYYYKFIVIGALGSVGIREDQVTFVEESSYHFSREWVQDQWRLCTIVPQQAVKDAWDRSYNPDMLSPMFCPGIQTLAEEHLDIDFQFGGTDQRGIFGFAERFLPQLGYRERGHMMNTMVPNLLGTKMSSSHPPKTKIMYLDDPETVREKINAAPWLGLDGTKNGVLSIIKNILIPAARLRIELASSKGGIGESHAAGSNGVNGGNASNGVNGSSGAHVSDDTTSATITTAAAAGDESVAAMGASAASDKASAPAAEEGVFSVGEGANSRHFFSYEDVEQALRDATISEDDVKAAVGAGMNQILDFVRKMYDGSADWQAVDRVAYPEAEQ